MMRVIFLALLVIESAFAGTDLGNGGDRIAIEFKEIGHSLLDKLKDNGEFQIEGFALTTVRNALVEVKVESTNKPLFIKGARKDAINYIQPDRIVVYEKGWNRMNETTKMQLVIHEILGLLGETDQDFARSRIVVRKALGDNNSNYKSSNTSTMSTVTMPSRQVIAMTRNVSATESQKKITEIFANVANVVMVVVDPSVANFDSRDAYMRSLTESSLAWAPTRMRISYDPWVHVVVVPNTEYLLPDMQRHFTALSPLTIDLEGNGKAIDIMAAPVVCSFSNIRTRGIGAQGCIFQEDVWDGIWLTLSRISASTSSVLPNEDKFPKDPIALGQWIEAGIAEVRGSCPATVYTIGEYFRCSRANISVVKNWIQSFEAYVSATGFKDEATLKKLRLHHFMLENLERSLRTIDSGLRLSSTSMRDVSEPSSIGLVFRREYEITIDHRPFNWATDGNTKFSDPQITQILNIVLAQMTGEVNGLANDMKLAQVLELTKRMEKKND